jgi:hypothetical protein
VGEYISVASAGGISNIGNVVNAASTTLQPGDWEVSGFIEVTHTGATSSTELFSAGSISLTTGSNDNPLHQNYSKYYGITSSTRYAIVPKRISISTATTVYLISQMVTITAGGLSASSVTSASALYARRVR